jgi:hypothetical protein
MERVLVSIVVLGSTACLRAGNFHCSSDFDCFRNNVDGTCEAVGYCSFPDPSCSQGQRYGDQSGSYAGQCVQPGVGGVDAMLPDMTVSTDAPPLQSVAFYTYSGRTDTPSNGSLTFSAFVPNMNKIFLLVSVQVASDCSLDTSVPTVASVTYNTTQLTQLAAITGTTCNENVTRTEQWGLVDPAVGTQTIAVTLTGSARRVAVKAYVFEGVNQLTPVRASRTMSGSGASIAVTVPSSTGDLVLDTVGASTAIQSPPAGQQFIYTNNALALLTIGNDGATTEKGDAPTVTMTRTLATSGEWQTIATSLQP